MIFLVFLFPLSIYLFILGAINRRSHPLVVSGVWEFIGVLFGASGFLLVGGPAALSSLSERWRMFWLLGQTGSGSSEGMWQFWVFLAVLYFLIVVIGAAVILAQHRHLTGVYNVDPGTVENCLILVCERLGLSPARSGNVFIFGAELAGVRYKVDVPAPGISHEAVQAAPAPATVPMPELAAIPAVLEVDTFARMRHVTLRWDPIASPLRRAVEEELEKVLDETPSSASDLGAWLTIAAVALFCFTLAGTAVVMLMRMTR